MTDMIRVTNITEEYIRDLDSRWEDGDKDTQNIVYGHIRHAVTEVVHRLLNQE